MTTKAPERICFVNCGLPAEDCACYRSMINAATVPADLHAAVVAERDAAVKRAAAMHRRAQVAEGNIVRALWWVDAGLADPAGSPFQASRYFLTEARAALAKQEPKE